MTIDNYTETACPDFSGKKALVLDGAMKGAIVALMANCGFTKADSVEDADLVVFAGGADVDPSLYGQEAISQTYSDRNRDNREIEVFTEAVKLGKPMFGICRGAQFLHVMAGGELWQHVTNHAGKDHFIVDTDEGTRVSATSLHHQMVRPSAKVNMQIVAVCEDEITTMREDENILVFTKQMNTNTLSAEERLEIEAAYYDDILAFTVQGHPEIGSDEYKSWTMHKVAEYLFDSDDSDDEEEEQIEVTIVEGT